METMYPNPSPTAPAPAPVAAPAPAPSPPDLIDDQQPSPPPSDLLDVTGSTATVQQDGNCVAPLDFLSRIGGFNVLVNAVKVSRSERGDRCFWCGSGVMQNCCINVGRWVYVSRCFSF